MFNDIRYAFRALSKSPGFALTAIISIALAISANSTIFSIADALLLRPLPVPDASGVVSLRLVPATLSTELIGNSGEMSYADYMDFRNNLRSFTGLVAYALMPVGFAQDRGVQPQLKMGFVASGNFFSVMSIDPQMGRGFREDEDVVAGRDAVVVLSYEFWESDFQRDSAIVGRRVILNGLDFEVIGVMPESFYGMDQYVRPAFFVPAAMAPKLATVSPNWLTDRGERSVLVKGRLKAGVSTAAASEEASLFAKSLEELHPKTNLGFRAVVRTELETRMEMEPTAATDFGFVLGLAFVVLLIACSNVANLMLGRGRARAREIAIRLAVGASRARVIRQLMLECVLIALAGAGLGLYIASFGIQMFSRIEFARDTPIRFGVQLDDRVLYFTLFVSVISALLFGLAPAFQATRTDLVSGLKAGNMNVARKRFFGRSALVAAQIAGSIVLLVTATQIYREFRHAFSSDPGFRADHRMTMRFDPGLIGYSSAQTQQFYETLVERARELPQVKSAALSFSLPLSRDFQMKTVMPEGFQSPDGAQTVSALTDFVDDHYFETLGVRLLEGREFLPTDTAASPRVAIVNEHFASLYLRENPVGKRFQLNDKNGPWVEVVGVTVTGKRIALTESPLAFLYFPLSQNPQPRMTLVAETYGDPIAVAMPMRDVGRGIDSNVPIFRVQTLDEVVASAKSVQEFLNVILISISVIGFVLAVLGLYAVVAFHVARRTREIGIRIALGAQRLSVMRAIMGDAAIMAIAGIGLGLVVSFAVRRLVGSVLPVAEFEAGAFFLISSGLLVTTLAAAAIPARRAARVSPIQALRED